jgi:ribosome biogenesis GTPase A
MKSVSKVSGIINWFPGHMKKALRTLDENAKNVDVYL